MPIREGMVMAKVEDKIEADIAIKLSDAVTELPVAKKMKVIDLSEGRSIVSAPKDRKVFELHSKSGRT